MTQTSQSIPLTKYDPFLDKAEIIYEQVTSKKKASWVPIVGTTALNSSVTINKTGVQDVVPVLERPETVQYLEAAFTATATGLSIAAPGVANIAVAATGTIQGDAFVIITDIIMITSGAANTGVKLPAITPLDVVTIINAGTVNIKVYPFLADYIGTAAVNVAVDLAAGARATFYAKSTAVAATTTAVWQRL
jgi:hypothetical protein